MVQKLYWALLEGELTQQAGNWRDRVRKVPDVAHGEVIANDDPAGRSAVLDFRVLAVRDGCTFVEIELQTGRYHQIRLQAAHHGFPVVGDALYGPRDIFGPAAEDHRERAVALHARS